MTPTDLKNPTEVKAISRHEVLCTLEGRGTGRRKGAETGRKNVYGAPPHRLIEILGTMKRYKLEPKRMKMVHPFKDKDANMVPHQRQSMARHLDEGGGPVIVYKEPGVYTDEIYSIYGY